MFGNYRGPNGLLRRIDRRNVQNGKEPALCTPAYWRRPCVGASRLRVANKVEHMDNAFPYGLSGMRLVDRDRLQQRSGPAVLLFDGVTQLVDVVLDHHIGHVLTAMDASVF
jgi:hypothetical protein